VEELTSALEELLTAPLERLQQMGEVGYQRVLERHSIDIEAAKLKQLFEKTLQPQAMANAENPVRQVA
jgi:colanic acid/amylovoran biosynthesis glycosyltransferase